MTQDEAVYIIGRLMEEDTIDELEDHDRQFIEHVNYWANTRGKMLSTYQVNRINQLWETYGE